MKEDYKKIKDFLKTLGYKQTGKDAFSQDMFENKNKVIYLSSKVVKKVKEETFKEMTAKMYK
jgi:hypothetical protein